MKGLVMKRTVAMWFTLLLPVYLANCGGDDGVMWRASSEGEIQLDSSGEKISLHGVLPFTAGGLYPPDSRATFSWCLADADEDEERTLEVYVVLHVFEKSEPGDYPAVPTGIQEPFVLLDLDKSPSDLPRDDWYPVDGQMHITSWQCAPLMTIEVDVEATFSHQTATESQISFTGSLRQEELQDHDLCKTLEEP